MFLDHSLDQVLLKIDFTVDTWPGTPSSAFSVKKTGRILHLRPEGLADRLNLRAMKSSTSLFGRVPAHEFDDASVTDRPFAVINDLQAGNERQKLVSIRRVQSRFLVTRVPDPTVRPACR